MIELSLIKLCLSYSNWEEAKRLGLSTSLFQGKELQTLFSVLDNWHLAHESDITVTDLSNLVFASVSKDHSFYEDVFLNLEKLESSDETARVLLNSLVRKNRLKALSLAAYDAYEGNDKDNKFDELMEAFSHAPEAVEDEEDEFVTDDLDELVDRAVATPGLPWRLKTLNRMLGPLRKGNMGLIFARPESGKTTLLCSEVTYMAEHCDGPILWFANEEDGDIVKLRIIQAAFAITMEQLLSDRAGWRTKFKEQYGGKILLLAQGTIASSKIERECAKRAPSLVIIDQLAHIQGFKQEKKNLALGDAFRWSREVAKEVCPVINIHQAGGEGEGVKWLNMNHVDEVKTAAQAHCDWILGLGKSNAEGMEQIRYASVSKNKLLGGPETDPNLRHGKMEILIDAQRARYKDLY